MSTVENMFTEVDITVWQETTYMYMYNCKVHTVCNSQKNDPLSFTAKKNNHNNGLSNIIRLAPLWKKKKKQYM